MIVTPSSTKTIVFSEDLTIKSVGIEHERLLTAVRGGGRVVAAIDPAASVDLTFIQLLIAAARSARASGGSLALAEPATGKLLETLRRGGFVERPEQRAFWLENSEV